MDTLSPILNRLIDGDLRCSRLLGYPILSIDAHAGSHESITRPRPRLHSPAARRDIKELGLHPSQRQPG